MTVSRLDKSLVSLKTYAKWVGKPEAIVRAKIDGGYVEGVVVGGKEFVKLAKYRCEFYKERARRGWA